jgi:hypothetical protein
MEQVLVYLFSLPSLVVYTVSGGIFGAIAGTIGLLISKKIRSKRLAQTITILLLVASIQISNTLVRHFQKEFAVKKAVRQLEDNKLFAVIFKLHPEALTESEEKFKEFLSGGISAEQVSQKSQEFGAELVQRYFQKHLLSASDEATHRLLKRNVYVMKLFQDHPEFCVAYYLGKPNFGKTEITEDFIKEETDLKADVIESSVSNPSLPPQAANIESLVKIIASSYHKKGYNLNNLQKIDRIETLAPKEGCEVAIEFSDALASLDTKQSSYVFKNLLYLSQQQ